MIKLANISRVYFIGIGGIGMSALARYFNQRGKLVFGYDKTKSPLCETLENEGIEINYEDDIALLDKKTDIVVYTPAIPEKHQQLNWYKERGYTVVKRSEMLGEITKNKFCIAVAGSHGKTTVSSMIAHILQRSLGCTAFLGGIATNYKSNYIYSDSKYVVVEADEYDRSFMTLSPDITVVTSIDSDHLDVYGSLEQIENEFIEFIDKLEEKGVLLLNDTVLNIQSRLSNEYKVLTYGTSIKCDYELNKHSILGGIYHFSVDTNKEKIEDLVLLLGGRHNLWNATAAVAVAKQLGIHNDEIRAALLQYRGVKRRFERHLDKPNLAYIDDYAHHPNEIKAFLESIKELYPKRTVTAIFQPHLYSRTQDLCADFGKALSLVENVILLPIYPAREEAIPGVTSELILKHIIDSDAKVMQKEELIGQLRNEDLDIVLTIGAGDIDRLVKPLLNMLKEKAEN